MGIAIDTSAIVDLERRGRRQLEHSRLPAGTVYLPGLVVAELWIGVELADSEARRTQRARKIEAILDGAIVLPFDDRVAPTYARVYAALRKAGTPIPANDLAIASLALYFGHELLVGGRDEAHFRAVPGLVVRVLGT